MGFCFCQDECSPAKGHCGGRERHRVATLGRVDSDWKTLTRSRGDNRIFGFIFGRMVAGYNPKKGTPHTRRSSHLPGHSGHPGGCNRTWQGNIYEQFMQDYKM